MTQKPGSIEEVDAQRSLIEALPAKVREIAEATEAASPWCGAYTAGVPCKFECFA